ncbi:MAG: alanine racemase [Gemmatimonadales bacterium]
MSARDSRAWVEVSLAAVVENARTVARTAGARLLPIVKANAYGLGAVAVSGALEAVEPWGYGVATIEEGAELRAAGIARRILVLLPATPGRFVSYRELGLTPVFDEPVALRAWTANGSGDPFHIEIDTGMARGGVRWDEVERIATLTDTPGFEGAFTQFHSSECADGTLARQLECYLAALARLPRQPRLRHVANSAAALREPSCALDLVRPGVFLYGGSPGGGVQPGCPVASLRARVVSVRRVHVGDGVSYNARWIASRETTIATLGVGYADGVPATLGPDGHGQVLLRGARCPIVGTVTMDLTLVDVGVVPVEVGEVATLLGEADGQRITLAELSAASGVQPRGLLTALGPRLPRLYG